MEHMDLIEGVDFSTENYTRIVSIGYRYRRGRETGRGSTKEQGNKAWKYWLFL